MEKEEKGDQAPVEEEPVFSGYAPLPYLHHEKGFVRLEVWFFCFVLFLFCFCFCYF